MLSYGIVFFMEKKTIELKFVLRKQSKNVYSRLDEILQNVWTWNLSHIWLHLMCDSVLFKRRTVVSVTWNTNDSLEIQKEFLDISNIFWDIFVEPLP